MSFTDLNDEIRKRFDLSDDTFGVVVIGINDDSPAAARGILAGDIIQKVDQVDIQNSTQISVSYTHLTLPTICSV